MPLLLMTAACHPGATDPVPWRIGVSFVDIDEPTEMIQRGILQSTRPDWEKVRWNSAGKSADKQRADLDDFFAEPVEALIVQPVDRGVLDYARERAAEKAIPLVLIREERLGPGELPDDLSRVETSWAGALQQLAQLGPATGGLTLLAAQPSHRAAVVEALRAECDESETSRGEACLALRSITDSGEERPGAPGPSAELPRHQPDPGSARRVALDDESLRQAIEATESPPIPPVGLASAACAQGLLDGSVAACLDRRPFEVGRAALHLARQVLGACQPGAAGGSGSALTLTLTRSQRERELTSGREWMREREPMREQEGMGERGWECAPRPRSLAGPSPSAGPAKRGEAPATQHSALSPQSSVLSPQHLVRVEPRLVPADEVAALTYRWPDLPLLSAAAGDRVVGDGFR